MKENTPRNITRREMDPLVKYVGDLGTKQYKKIKGEKKACKIQLKKRKRLTA